MKGYSHSSIGDRARQEDAKIVFEVNTDTHQGIFAMVCDGVGGMSNGGAASSFCAEHAEEVFISCLLEQDSIETALHFCAEGLDALLVEKLATDETDSSRCGTTLVAVYAEGNKAYWVSVGDSRIYLFHGDEIEQLTTDHNYALLLNKMVRRGEMTAEEAEREPRREALISYIGMDGIDYIDTDEIDFFPEKGDVLLLCSDGLYRMLSAEEMIQRIRKFSDDPEELVVDLVNAALEKKTKRHDNTTVAVLMECEETERFD